jgi:two-component system sensor histidine kinase KdpD
MLVHRRKSLFLGVALALSGVAAVTVLIQLIESRLEAHSLSILYLIVVLAVASRFGHWPAVVASIAAFLTFNWFFVEPRYTFVASEPDGWVMLVVFLLTAIITGELAAGQRRRADVSEEREREARVLYDTARSLGGPRFERALQEAADQLRNELDLRAIAIDVSAANDAAFRAAAGDGMLLPPSESLGRGTFRVLGEPPRSTDASAPSRARWVRAVPAAGAPTATGRAASQLHIVPISYGDRRVGSLLLVPGEGRARFSEVENHLLSTVAAQLAQGIERARLREEANDAEVLRRTDELKTSLLNTISHDLRTPLASIIASAGSLRQRDIGWSEEQVQEFAADIEEEARRLNRIVGNLLDLSRIEAGSLRPDKQWHDLAALIDDVLGRLRSSLAGHSVVVAVPEDLPPVLIDYVQIDEVLSNLVENAAKYTPPGTEIRIAAGPVDGTVAVHVADGGPGFTTAELPRLFEAFYRGDARGGRTGTGLGLAVARGLVEAHGGRIWAENRAGGGGLVGFTLPSAEGPEPIPVPLASGDEDSPPSATLPREGGGSVTRVAS